MNLEYLMTRIWAQNQVYGSVLAALIKTHPDKMALQHAIRSFTAMDQARRDLEQAKGGVPSELPELVATMSAIWIEMAGEE